MSYRKSVVGLGITIGLLLTASSLAVAEPAPRPDPMLDNGPPLWDANHDGVYTCAEWKSYLERIFTLADRNRDGNLDKSEFATVKKATASVLPEAEFGYFDENQDGKISRAEFVGKQSEFIMRYDTNGDCRVTAAEIKAGDAPKGPQGPAQKSRDVFH